MATVNPDEFEVETDDDGAWLTCPDRPCEWEKELPVRVRIGVINAWVKDHTAFHLKRAPHSRE